MKPRNKSDCSIYSKAETGSVAHGLTINCDRETSEYLTTIADIMAQMRPFEELVAEATGCPDPDFYADEEDWDF